MDLMNQENLSFIPDALTDADISTVTSIEKTLDSFTKNNDFNADHDAILERMQKMSPKEMKAIFSQFLKFHTFIGNLEKVYKYYQRNLDVAPLLMNWKRKETDLYLVIIGESMRVYMIKNKTKTILELDKVNGTLKIDNQPSPQIEIFFELFTDFSFYQENKLLKFFNYSGDLAKTSL